MVSRVFRSARCCTACLVVILGVKEYARGHALCACWVDMLCVKEHTSPHAAMRYARAGLTCFALSKYTSLHAVAPHAFVVFFFFFALRNSRAGREKLHWVFRIFKVIVVSVIICSCSFFKTIVFSLVALQRVC
jgi:hypothetical protein